VGVSPGTENSPDSLEAIRATVAAANGDLYRHIALYLQVLRSVLQHRVDQACFHLVTREHADSYLQLGAKDRLLLHQRLRQLVERCTCLLTLEQLAILAAQMQRRRRQRQQRQQHQLLRQLLRPEEASPPQGEGQASDAETVPSASTPHPPGISPPGSVRLQMAPPLGEPWLQWAFQPPMAGPDVPEQGDLTELDDLEEEPDGGSSTALDEDDPDQDDPSLDSLEEGDDGSGFSPQLLEALGMTEEELAALFHSAPGPDPGAAPSRQSGDRRQAAAAESTAGIDAGLAPGEEPPAAGAAAGRLSDRDHHVRESRDIESRDSESREGLGSRGETVDGETDDRLLSAGESSDSAGRDGTTDTTRLEPGRLPDDPILLLQWLDALERALARRLRNLSHAINVELLRSGISTSLLPASLLEAVLRGQVETQSSPANLLRLQLPFGLKPGASPLVSQAVLLRVVDLEMEEPRLRTCRRRLQQHRQELRRMAQQYRRLQRRLQAREAERLWLQDIRRSRARPD